MEKFYNWIERSFWNSIEIIEYIGQVTNLGYELTNVIIFVIIQPSLILIFLILWLLEKRKNKSLINLKETRKSTFKEFLWRFSRVLSVLVLLIEIILLYSIYNGGLIKFPLNHIFRPEIMNSIVIILPITILIVFNFLSFGRASIWIKKI